MDFYPTHRHVKRGTLYRVLGAGFVELPNGFVINDNELVHIRLGTNGIHYVKRFSPEGVGSPEETFLGVGFAQASDSYVVRDGDAVVVYQGMDGRLWVRPFDQFMDGRFEQVNHDVFTTLRLFREFVVKGATQWELGCNHHHPMWTMVAEALGEKHNNKTCNCGPEWRFVQPGNSKTLAELIEEERQSSA